ncbi:hypothetical protein GA0061078_0130 [Bifidobacterium bohemicum]|uniref:Uncharacterized protein n=1 Tax=Bifidobacterium bohemicum DSM 22767 TaxID=1437606 RepID=A0A086ZG69_9BIFI|nr:hypothetical protein [Bifidobacterium bohemicum]KFI45519.1 hypothetical protein BBOH_1071 [Bifidobacterium bohemicum DSM 22767]SCB71667.1 hypothetical protein GA0061078_0130 [Bifidobacterium bohemicum]
MDVLDELAEFRLNAELGGLRVLRAGAQNDVSWAEERVSSLNSEIQSMQESINKAKSYRDIELADLKAKSKQVHDDLVKAGKEVNKGMDESSTQSGVEKISSDSAGTIDSICAACNSLIKRLNGQLGDLRSEREGAEADVVSAKARRDSLDGQISSTQSKLDGLRPGS